MSIKAKVPRDPPRLSAMAEALWLIKWELFIPVLILGGLMSGLTSLDESAAITALYTFVVEVFIYKDLSIRKDLPRVAMASMSLAGAVILILAMANALINFVVQEQIPGKVLESMVSLGLTQGWQFLVVLNVFLLVLGMVMDGFSAILVAVPAFKRVEPAITSGPTTGTTLTSAALVIEEPGTQVTATVKAPSFRACSTAPTV